MEEVSSVYTSPFIDSDYLKMALRARKVSGAFDKRPPCVIGGLQFVVGSCPYLTPGSVVFLSSLHQNLYFKICFKLSKD